jgi:16S rRNA (uracil1498-N3)-methyltransferase
VPDRFCAPVSFAAPVIELSRDESQHLASVLRKSPGDAVVVFDGRGNAAEAVVESVGKRTSTVRIIRRLPTTLAVSPRIELATAVPKGDRAGWLIEKATELGADCWTPLRLTRSVVDPGDGKLDKLRQTVITACKQCGRNQLLEIGATQVWTEWLAAATRRGSVMIAHPSGSRITARQEPRPPDTDAASQPGIAIAIGPEGGFTDDEIDAAVDAGAVLVNLGPHILRIESAAIAALAWLRLSTDRRTVPDA